MTGCKLNGLPEQLHRQLVPAYLVSDHSQMKQRLRIAGLSGEDLAVQRFCIAQPAGLMVFQSEGKSLLRCEGRGGEHTDWKKDTRAVGKAISSQGAGEINLSWRGLGDSVIGHFPPDS
jgi:hypothetical protein